jgi:hypothetical protein
MNSYFNISRELKSCFTNNSFFKVLLPLDAIILLIGLIFIFLNRVIGFGFTPLINALAYWVFILGLLLTYANLRHVFIYSGLFAYAAIEIIRLIIIIFSNWYFSWSTLFNALVFAYLGYIAFRNYSVSG